MRKYIYHFHIMGKCMRNLSLVILLTTLSFSDLNKSMSQTLTFEALKMIELGPIAQGSTNILDNLP